MPCSGVSALYGVNPNLKKRTYIQSILIRLLLPSIYTFIQVMLYSVLFDCDDNFFAWNQSSLNLFQVLFLVLVKL